MLGPIRYAAANAGVRSQVAQLLPPGTWGALLAASDLDDVVSILSATPYRDTLLPTAGAGVEPEQIERALNTALSHASRRPLKFLHGSERALLDWLWRRFEVDNTRIVLRAVTSGSVSPRVVASLIPLGTASGIAWDALLHAKSVADLIGQLQATYYGAIYAAALSEALDRYRHEGGVFVLEVSLELMYFHRLQRLLDDLSGGDRHDAEQLVGTMLSVENLLAAFRYRIYFNLSPEEIVGYTLQRGLRVDSEIVREIAAGAAPVDIVRRLWGDRLPGMAGIAAMSPREALPALELAFRRYRHGMAWEALEGYPFRLGAVLAYEALLEDEVHDLIAVVEGTAAGWPEEQVHPYLIGSRGSRA
jgi:V/A-type H+-transporting ATPase subunit C